MTPPNPRSSLPSTSRKAQVRPFRLLPRIKRCCPAVLASVIGSDELNCCSCIRIRLKSSPPTLTFPKKEMMTNLSHVLVLFGWNASLGVCIVAMTSEFQQHYGIVVASCNTFRAQKFGANFFGGRVFDSGLRQYFFGQIHDFQILLYGN